MNDRVIQPVSPNSRALRRLVPASALLVTGLLTTVTTGCAGAPRPATAHGKAVRVVGELTDNGLGCPAVKTADGTIYTLARGLEGLKPGQTLEIDGYVTEMQRHCGVGTPVMPQRAVRVHTPAATGG